MTFNQFIKLKYNSYPGIKNHFKSLKNFRESWGKFYPGLEYEWMQTFKGKTVSLKELTCIIKTFLNAKGYNLSVSDTPYIIRIFERYYKITIPTLYGIRSKEFWKEKLNSDSAT